MILKSPREILCIHLCCENFAAEAVYSYLANELQPVLSQQTLTLLSFRRRRLIFPPSVIGLSLLLQLGHVTACQSQLHPQRCSTHSSSDWKLNFTLAATICRLLTHADVPYNFVPTLLSHPTAAQLVLLFCLLCPSIPGTLRHFNNFCLIILIKCRSLYFSAQPFLRSC